MDKPIWLVISIVIGLIVLLGLSVVIQDYPSKLIDTLKIMGLGG